MTRLAQIGFSLLTALVVVVLVWSSMTEGKSGARANPLASGAAEGERPPEASGPLPAPDSEDGARHRSAADLDIRDEPTKQVTTVRTYLQEYWGDRWPEIEQAMLEARVDLDQQYEPVTWECASVVLEPMVSMTPEERTGATSVFVRWQDDSDPEAMRDWLRTEFAVPRSLDLDDADLTALNDITRASNEELSLLAQEWVDRTDFYCMERWRSGDFVKAPFGTIGVSKELGIYSKTAAASGWSIVITLERERYPDMVELDERTARLRELRDLEVTRYLKERATR